MNSTSKDINTRKILLTLRWRNFGYLILTIGVSIIVGSLRSPDLSGFLITGIIILSTGVVIEILVLLFNCPFCAKKFFTHSNWSIAKHRCSNCGAGADGINP